MRILNSEEIDAVLRVATPAYRNVLATAVFTGLRQSELLGLTWADVDLDAGVVRVRRQLDRGGGYSAAEDAALEARRRPDAVAGDAAARAQARLCLLRPDRPGLRDAERPAAVLPQPDPRASRLALAKAGLDGDGRAAAALPRPSAHLRLAPDRARTEHRLHRQSARPRLPSFTLMSTAACSTGPNTPAAPATGSKPPSAGCLRRPSRSFPPLFQEPA